MARPRRDEIDTRTTDRLLRAAEDAFGRGGFHGTRLEDIAREAGIRRPSLLYHFGSKEALYETVVRRAFAQLGAALADAMRIEGPFEERANGLISAFANFLEAHPGVAPLILRELIGGRGPGHDILLAEIAPLIDATEAFVRAQQVVRPGVPVRLAVVQIATSLLVRAAAGPLRDAFWGDVSETHALVHSLFEAGDTLADDGATARAS